MRVFSLSSSAEDVRWLARCYRSIFPAGSPRGRVGLEHCLSLLLDNPYAGRAIADDMREFSIPRTPFSLIHQIAGDQIEIVRLWDQRADRGALGLFDEGPETE